MTDPIVIELDEIDSTNNYLKQHSELWQKNFTTVLARRQTAGRGRFQRSWYSQPGKDLTFSFVLRPSEVVSSINTITLLVGLGLVRTLREYLGDDVVVKWPNDIYYKEKKIAGILCEQLIKDGTGILIIGMGLNVNSRTVPEPIRDSATTMYMIQQKEIDRIELLQQVLEDQSELLDNCSIPLNKKLLEEWKRSTISLGKEVSFFHKDGRIKGTIEDIDGYGALIIKDEHHKSHIVPHEIIYETGI